MIFRNIVGFIVPLAVGATAFLYVSSLDNVTPTLEENTTHQQNTFIVREPPPPERPVDVSSEIAAVEDTSSAVQVQVQLDDAAQLSNNVNSIKCTGTTVEQYRCYIPFYRDLVVHKGIEIALTDIKKRYNENDTFIITQCHPLMHVIGQTASETYNTIGEAYQHGDSFCWSGYYHGIMEAILSSMDRDEVPQKLETICNSIPGKESYTFDYFNCVHGIGHGLMLITNNELFESLELCDNFSGTWESTSCYGGVFMENIIANEINHFSKYLKDDDPLYPCNAVAATYKNSCYLMHTSHMLKAVNSDFTKMFDLCSQVEELYVDTCYQSLGRDASGRSSSSVAPTRERCLLGKDYRQRSNCVIGAVKDFISYHHSDIQSKELCAIFSENLQQLCYSTTESYYTTL